MGAKQFLENALLHWEKFVVQIRRVEKVFNVWVPRVHKLPLFGLAFLWNRFGENGFIGWWQVFIGFPTDSMHRNFGSHVTHWNVAAIGKNSSSYARPGNFIFL